MADRFTLLKKIGRGGMAVVWRARDEETGAIVALKVLNSAYAEDPDYEVRFERELELAQRIKSPNVVGVVGYGVRKGAPYLALEYVDGQTLRQRLAEHGPYSWDETKGLLLQIANGLAAAHAAGVVHRDIKPSNILMSSEGVAKIADFGIARGVDLTRVTGTSTLLGTPTYLPPEGPRDARSDLYSLGVLAYELLAGVPPFEGSTHAEVLMAHVRAAPDLQRLPNVARPTIGWLLEKDPNLRPQAAGELIEALEGKRAARTQVAAPPERVTAAATALAAEPVQAPPPAAAAPPATPLAPPAPPALATAPMARAAPPPLAQPFGPPRQVPARQTQAPRQADYSGPIALLLVLGLVVVLAIAGAAILMSGSLNGPSGRTSPPATATSQPTGTPTPTPTRTAAPQESSSVSVPDIVGLTEVDALRALAAAGLLPGSRAELNDSVVPAGSVIGSNPGAGVMVPRGTTVDYVVSLGPTPTPTPTDTPTPAPTDTPSPTSVP